MPATSATVEDDAFLRTCFKGVCSGRNYGQTEFGSLVDGEELGMLLLRIPNPGVSADQIEVSLHFFAEADLDGVALTLTAIPISPPCDWAEGGQDDDTLEKGEAGVTYLDCNGNPQAATPWSEEGNVWDHIDLTWSAGEFTFDKGEIIAGQGFSATMVVDRLVAGPTPDSLLIVSNTSASGELFVYTSEDDLEPPVVDVFSPCP